MISLISSYFSYFSKWNCCRKKAQPELPGAVSDAAQKAIRSTVLQREIDSIKDQKLEKAFESEFLCRIVGKERADLKTALKRLSSSATTDSLRAFKRGDWTHPVFKTDNWPLLAIDAYIQGQLNEWQASKLFLFDSCRNYPNFQIHELIESKEGSNYSERLLTESLGLIEFKNYQGLLKLISKNSQFFSFKVPKIRSQDLGREIKQGNANLYQVFYRLDQKLFVIDRGDVLQILIIPPDLWYDILQIQYGSHAILPIPVLGYRDGEAMDHPLKRVMGIPCRYVKDPATIHGIPSHFCGLYGHDAYHLAVESANIHRPLWIELRKKGKVPEVVRETIGDRDFPLYCKGDPGRKFLPVYSLTDEEKFWYVFASNALLCRKENTHALLKCLFTDGAELAAQYGITYQSLKKCAENEDPDSQRVSLKPLFQAACEIQKELIHRS